MATQRICSVGGCEKPFLAKGYCRTHYQRWRDGRDLTAPLYGTGEPLKLLMASLLIETEECISWPFSRYSSGHAAVSLSHRKMSSATRMICELKHEAPPTPRHQAAHSCGKGHEGCINWKHLRWATVKENAQDKWDHGTMMMGEKHPMHKLTQNQVDQIRLIASESGFENGVGRRLAGQFGVSPSTISLILLGKLWPLEQRSAQPR